MPDIIDNIKVGELIKKKLKERNMTQEDLAKELSISKSAVSQNLNGKSSFDIQNLIAISKLFDISMEELLIVNTDETNKTVISEYEKLVKNGIDSFLNLEISNMNISNPDIYGKTLIEYVIEYNNLEIFSLLHQSNIKLLEDTHYKARFVYTKLIWYILKNNLDNISKYLTRYVELYNSLTFLEESYSKDIFSFLNKEKYQNLVLTLFSSYVTQDINILSIIKKNKKIPYLSKTEWYENIAKYELGTILKTINCKLKFVSDYESILKIFLKHKYYDGIKWYLQNNDFLGSNIELRLVYAQDIIYSIAVLGDLDILKIAIDKKLYVNFNKLIYQLITNNHELAYMCCINNYSDKIDFQQVAYASVISSNLKLLKHIIKKLNQNDLNYILSIVHPRDIAIIEYLISKGALFTIEYYNANTMEKINKIINKLLKESENGNNS